MAGGITRCADDDDDDDDDDESWHLCRQHDDNYYIICCRSSRFCRFHICISICQVRSYFHFYFPTQCCAKHCISRQLCLSICLSLGIFSILERVFLLSLRVHSKLFCNNFVRMIMYYNYMSIFTCLWTSQLYTSDEICKIHQKYNCVENDFCIYYYTLWHVCNNSLVANAIVTPIYFA